MTKKPKTGVDQLRQGMAGRALSHKLPAAFKAEPLAGPEIRITNLQTGVNVDIGICNYLGAVTALRAFCTQDIPIKAIIAVKGGVVQGVRANIPMEVDVFDGDNLTEEGYSGEEQSGMWRVVERDYPETVY